MRYKSEMTVRLAENRGQAAAEGNGQDSSDSDNSVDFSLQMRRFVPLSMDEMHGQDMIGAKTKALATRPKTAAAVVVYSDSDSDGFEQQRARQGRAAAASIVPNSRIVGRDVASASFLSFSAMRAGSATQNTAREKDKLLYGSGSDDGC
jgi:hypothetical protein